MRCKHGETSCVCSLCDLETIKRHGDKSPSGSTGSIPLMQRALDLYAPPFRFSHGFIFDSKGEMVSDDTLEGQDAIQRVRGWGRIGYMEEAEALQDEVGRIIAEALTDYWNKQKGN